MGDVESGLPAPPAPPAGAPPAAAPATGRAAPAQTAPAAPAPAPDETDRLTADFARAMRDQVRQLVEFRRRFEPEPTRMVTFEDVEGQRERAAARPRAEAWAAEARAAPGLAALSGPPAPDAPRALRDQPPRPPLADLPQFTVRDGETHDYLTDLDAETLKRLAEVQGQLDGLGAQVTVIRQGLQALASGTERQRRQEAAHQDRLHRALAAARADIAALHATVGDVDARLKRAQNGSAGALAGGGRPLPGWSVTAISGDRAWLRTPRGGRVTVVAGERLKGVGTVRAVDGLRGVVTMSDGRVVR